MESDVGTKLIAAIGGIGAAIYGFWRMVKKDRREDKAADTTHESWNQIVQALREEVSRLSERLALVEEQNRKCEARNEELHLEIVDLKKKLHVV